ncbi:hypothetical protein [Roseovarius dicentrarchi]|uniref:hypothetical protein n=1 Tax=Roseovarius dicentrarchi TaxID=2250573 RepID=UPI001EF0BB6A|nr:hypothetical protein [Roseovarius dicentrarchi]
MSEDAPGRRAEFVARGTYRRRRLIDAAGLLPILGALLFLVPLLWVGAQEGAAPRTSHVLLYLFAVWALLVVLSALVSRGLGASGDVAAREDAGPDDMDTASPDTGDDAPPARRG